jgi:hypothetical protein
VISSSVAASRRSVVEPSVTSARAPLSVAMRSPVVSGRLRPMVTHSLVSALKSQTCPVASLRRATRLGGSTIGCACTLNAAAKATSALSTTIQTRIA